MLTWQTHTHNIMRRMRVSVRYSQRSKCNVKWNISFCCHNMNNSWMDTLLMATLTQQQQQQQHSSNDVLMCLLKGRTNVHTCLLHEWVSLFWFSAYFVLFVCSSLTVLDRNRNQSNDWNTFTNCPAMTLNLWANWQFFQRMKLGQIKMAHQEMWWPSHPESWAAVPIVW